MKGFEEPVFKVGDVLRVRGTYDHGEVLFVGSYGSGHAWYELNMYGVNGHRFVKRFNEEDLILG